MTVSVKLAPDPTPATSVCFIDQGSTMIGMVILANNASVAIFNGYLDLTQGNKQISDVGDRADTTTLGVDALAGTTLIQERGPTAAVDQGNYKPSIALTKAMIAALP